MSMFETFVKTLAKNIDVPALLEHPKVKELVATITELRDVHKENNKILREMHALQVENSLRLDNLEQAGNNSNANITASENIRLIK